VDAEDGEGNDEGDMGDCGGATLIFKDGVSSEVSIDDGEGLAFLGFGGT